MKNSKQVPVYITWILVFIFSCDAAVSSAQLRAMLDQADAIQELREFAQSTNTSIAAQSAEIDKDIEVATAHFDRSIAEVDDFETRLLKQLDDIEISISTAMEQGSDDIAARASGWRWPFIGVLALACCIGFLVTKRVKREFRRTSLGGL